MPYPSTADLEAGRARLAAEWARMLTADLHAHAIALADTDHRAGSRPTATTPAGIAATDAEIRAQRRRAEGRTSTAGKRGSMRDRVHRKIDRDRTARASGHVL